MCAEQLDKNGFQFSEAKNVQYPRSIFLIIATEFCERFSFCGLKSRFTNNYPSFSLQMYPKCVQTVRNDVPLFTMLAILSLYLRNVLLFHENGATVIYHAFIMLCYFVPVFGAILADGYLGRFRTILHFSILYSIGNILLCFAAVPSTVISPITLMYVGLILIASGTGGIKPCVAAFGGDQFNLPEQHERLQQFFSIFYFTINLGGLSGMVLTPILRKTFVCFGDDTCYALGFGFPAALMVIASLLFLAGKPLYRLKQPKENITLSFINCIWYATRRRVFSKEPCQNEGHWLDYASDTFPPKLIADVKTVLAILFLYIPLPLFWSLFDQQGSRWTFQASRMNGLFLGMQILPDQMQVINPAMVLLLIPLFNKTIYPWMGRMRLLRLPLHRMVVGGLFAGLAFITSGILELKLEANYPSAPGKGDARLNFVNTLQCDIDLVASFESDMNFISGEKKVVHLIAVDSTKYDVLLLAPPVCGDISMAKTTLELIVRATEYRVGTVVVGLTGKYLTAIEMEPDVFEKSPSGGAKIRITFFRSSPELFNFTVSLESSGRLRNAYFVPSEDTLSVSAYEELEPGLFRYWVRNGDDPDNDHEDSFDLKPGGVYVLVIREYNGVIVFHELFTMTPPNDVHIFWLIPQYLLLSIAEVMFAIPGLEFSFTQAPMSMKTITIAAWYASVALGNLMVIFITQAGIFEGQAREFFLFAALILGNMVMFASMVGKYTYVVLEADSSSGDSDAREVSSSIHVTDVRGHVSTSTTTISTRIDPSYVQLSG